jgi:hypothetical protein
MGTETKMIILKKVEKNVYKICQNLPIILKNEATKKIKKIVKLDSNEEIRLLSYFFYCSLPPKQQKKISLSLIIDLGTANLWLWAALEIFDDLLDDEDNRDELPIGIFAFCTFEETINKIIKDNGMLRELWQNKKQAMLNANLYERKYLRGQKRKRPDFSKLSDRSFLHVFGPIILLNKINYSTKNLIKSLEKYLTIRQKLDDIYDCQTDLAKGHLNYANWLQSQLSYNEYRNKIIRLKKSWLQEMKSAEDKIQPFFLKTFFSKISATIVENLDSSTKL